MERDRRRTLIQAILVCSVLIYSVNSAACKKSTECNGSTCNSSTKKCQCTRMDHFGEMCENNCGLLCSTNNLHCQVNGTGVNRHTTCECVEDFLPNNVSNILQGCSSKHSCPEDSGCTAQNTGECTKEGKGYVCTCKPGFYGQKCEQACKSDKCKNNDNTECTDPTPPDNNVKCICKTGYEPIIPDKPEDKGCIKGKCGSLPKGCCNFGIAIEHSILK